MAGPLTVDQIVALDITTPAWLWQKGGPVPVERVRCVGKHNDPEKGLVAHLDFWPEGFGLLRPAAMGLRSANMGTEFEFVPVQVSSDWDCDVLVWGLSREHDAFQVFTTQ